MVMRLNKQLLASFIESLSQLSISKLMLLFIGICFLLIGCNKYVSVNFNQSKQSFSYKLPFEGGYAYNENGLYKILLKFYKPSKLFIKDTDERLHLYIICNERGINTQTDSSDVKVFFISVQQRPLYGSMEVKDFKVQRIGSILSISGKMVSNHVYPRNHNDITIVSLFENLPVVKVNSKDDLQAHSNDYFKEKLEEMFTPEW